MTTNYCRPNAHKALRGALTFQLIFVYAQAFGIALNSRTEPNRNRYRYRYRNQNDDRKGIDDIALSTPPYLIFSSYELIFGSAFSVRISIWTTEQNLYRNKPTNGKNVSFYYNIRYCVFHLCVRYSVILC